MLRAIDLRDVTELVNWLVNIAQGFDRRYPAPAKEATPVIVAYLDVV